MAHVVFLRASNIGGRNVFRPAKLARDLAHLDVVNIGAAGTFVVRARATAEAVRREILAKLSFTDLSVHAADDVVAFVDRVRVPGQPAVAREAPLGLWVGVGGFAS